MYIVNYGIEDKADIEYLHISFSNGSSLLVYNGEGGFPFEKEDMKVMFIDRDGKDASEKVSYRFVNDDVEDIRVDVVGINMPIKITNINGETRCSIM